MVAVPLLGGFYQSRSLVANAQRCVNLYPEPNPEGSDKPMTSYPTPGLTLLLSGTETQVAQVRGVYTSTREQLFAVIGTKLYYINSGWVPQLVTTLASAIGQVKMVDNGIEMLVVDGTTNGYIVNLSSLGSTTISGGAFYGANFVEYQDTYFLLNRPGSNQFYSSDSNGATFSPTNIAAKTGFPDWIGAIASMRREIWLLGRGRSGEIWYNSGAPGFPFEIVPGAYLDQAIVAPYSLSHGDLELFWLGKSINGQSSVLRGANYKAEEIDTFAIGSQIQTYPVLDDAIGMLYQQDKHEYYMLTFPTQDVTWVFDISTGLWHQRGWTDDNGHLHRHRANCICSAYGQVVVGDWENGNIYKFDFNNYTDNGQPIVRRRSFPHMVGGANTISYNRFIADMDCGNITGSPAQTPEVFLHWSNDRGHSYGTAMPASIGNTGQYYTRPTWNNVGYSMDRVFELFWSSPVFTALNGAWVDAIGSKHGG